MAKGKKVKAGDPEILTFPYGNVPNAGAPKDFEAGKSTKVFELPAEHITGDANEVVCTTVPTRRLSDTPDKNPDGWCECFIDQATKKRIFSQPGFPHPIPRPRLKMYSIEPAPGMGLGMFATCDIRLGELIIAERPLLLVPAAARMHVNRYPPHYTKEQMLQAAMAEQNHLYELTVSRMLPETRAAFMALHNSHQHDGSGTALGIVRTNGFGISDRPDALRFQNDRSPGGQFSIVCDKMSRVNHSCCPNTTHSFDLPSFSMHLYATRDIKKGEQIWTMYTELLAPAAERAETLVRYGVSPCVCVACLNPAVSDKRRELISSINIKWMFSTVSTQVLDRSLPGDYALRRFQAAVDLVVAEGLECVPDKYVVLLYMIGQLHSRLGNGREARAYLRKAKIAMHDSIGTWEEVVEKMEPILVLLNARPL